MDPHDTLVVQHPVCLTNDSEYLIPGTLYTRATPVSTRSPSAPPAVLLPSVPRGLGPLTHGRAIGMHGVLQAALLEQSLDLRDIGAHGGAVDTHLFSEESWNPN